MFIFQMHQLTSSRPITPAPITTSFLGTADKDNAPVDDTIVFSSIWKRGNLVNITTYTSVDLNWEWAKHRLKQLSSGKQNCLSWRLLINENFDITTYVLLLREHYSLWNQRFNFHPCFYLSNKPLWIFSTSYSYYYKASMNF